MYKQTAIALLLFAFVVLAKAYYFEEDEFEDYFEDVDTLQNGNVRIAVGLDSYASQGKCTYNVLRNQVSGNTNFQDVRNSITFSCPTKEYIPKLALASNNNGNNINFSGPVSRLARNGVITFTVEASRVIGGGWVPPKRSCFERTISGIRSCCYLASYGTVCDYSLKRGEVCQDQCNNK